METQDRNDYGISTRPLKKQKRIAKDSRENLSIGSTSNLSRSRLVKSRNTKTNGKQNDEYINSKNIDSLGSKSLGFLVREKSTNKHDLEDLVNSSGELDSFDDDQDSEGRSNSSGDRVQHSSGSDSASEKEMSESGDNLATNLGYLPKKAIAHGDKNRNDSIASLERNLQHQTGITKMVSRIRPLSKSTASASDHIEHTEISNGKVVDAKSSFATIDVVPWLIASLAAMEIRRPTAIQKSCIPQILKGRDVIGGSKTGSGKTVTFAVPIIQKCAEDPMGIFALILTPTRELALQIFEQFNAISAPQSMKIILITGGTELRTQAIALASRPHIVIATPGRLADHVNTSGNDTIAGFRRTRIVVLDEADRLLAPGPGSMLPDVETCLGALPPSSDRQTCLFTATLTQEVMALKDMPRSGRTPIFVCDIDSESDLAIPTTLQQTFLLVPPVMKEAYLHILLQTPNNIARKSIIVFCNRTKTADLLERLLRGLDHSVTSLHSKLPQRDRTSNLSRFRARAARILIASDVASRGLDIPEVDLVVNYDVPRNPDDYIHRVGRSARAGRKGDSVIMVDRRDIELILAIEARVGQKMTEYAEEGVNVQTRVVRDALKLVGEKKREVIIGIEEGRDVKGNRTRGRIRRLE